MRKCTRMIKVVDLFGGIGAIRKALINIDVTHEIMHYMVKITFQNLLLVIIYQTQK